jgi:hypothetical protein
MKKLFVLLVFITITFVSCQMNGTSDNQDVKNSISYFKDERTGLCFASINSSTYTGYKVTSITCVPCDSLKKVGIK